MKQPESFFNARVTDESSSPPLVGICVGYEGGVWRSSQFVAHAMEWLPEFCFTNDELKKLGPENAVVMLRQAARTVYTTDKFSRRGEFGELFLHIALRQFYGSHPMVSKIYYKSSTNETVKGFDAVHIVEAADGLQLWLGEVKFYKILSQAIVDVVKELWQHTDRDYLRDEFMLIGGKVDSSSPHYQAFQRLISRNASLDQIFSRIVIPVFLTYESACVASHTSVCSQYEKQFEEEIRAGLAQFSGKSLPDVSIVLVLLPLSEKAALVEALHNKLKVWQEI